MIYLKRIKSYRGNSIRLFYYANMGSLKHYYKFLSIREVNITNGT